MRIVGITGGFGSGKSTVARMLVEHGASLIDADRIAHEILEHNGLVIREIRKKFGNDFIIRGVVDRGKMAEAVFGQPARLSRLEAILHPRVIQRIKAGIREQERKGTSILVLDVPLLYETGLDVLMDIVIVVYASQRVCNTRIHARGGLAQSQIRQRVKAQMPLKAKMAMADIIIDNRDTILSLRKQVRAVWKGLLACS